MTAKEDSIKGKRIYFLDNLRTFMIFLVVVLHSGLVYEKSVFSSYFWIVYDPATNNLATVLRVIMDIFIMSTIFFISGYLTPISLGKKTRRAYLKSKFKRLIVPWMIAVLTLIPLYKFIFLYSRNLPQQNWTTYFHWSNEIWSQNWLWFLPVLFLFDILYLLFSRVKIELPDITLKQAVGAIFIIGFIYSICMDMFNFQGWTKTILLDFQNERLLTYFMMFLLGSLCYKRNLFESKPKNMKFNLTIISTGWIPVTIYYFFYQNSLMNPGKFIVSDIADTFLLWFSFNLSLLCLLYIMINTFRVYLDKQGRISRELNRNSYHVYIIHTIVMGGLAFTMLNTALPSLLKFLLLTVSTFAVSNFFITIYRKTIQSKIFTKRKDVIMRNVTTVILFITLLACGKQENPVPKIDLHTATVTGNLEVVQQHIKAGSDLNIKEHTRGSTPLITATVFGKTEVALALIEAGADVNYQNNEGSTALITAAFFCHTEIVKSLLNKGADKSLRNKAGRNALDSVSRPFDDVKGIYDGLGAALEPLGLKLDYEWIKKTRPRIAEILQ